MKQIINTIRILVGLFFLYSGIVKGIDPLGLSFKLGEYFHEGVLNLPFLVDFSLPIALFVIGLEIFLGVILLVGTHKKWVFILLFGLIVFFSFLTFYSAYFNKVTDCGCFGDAMKLTPWQSFYKNVGLLLLIIILILGRPFIQLHFTQFSRNFIVLSFLAFYLLIAYFGLFHLPLIDFRAYKTGTNILDGMKTAKELGLPESKTQLIYTLINKNTKEEKQVSDEEYINQNWWEKPEWEIDESKTQEIELVKGYEPPIKDFIINCNGKEVTQDLLKEEKLVLITAYAPDKVSEKALSKVINLKKELEKLNIKVVFVSSKKIKNVETCTMDETVLKTMIRANPGVVLIRKATILKEFHWNDLPEAKKLADYFLISSKNQQK